MSSTTDIAPRLATSSNFTIENRPPDPSEQSLELPFDEYNPTIFRRWALRAAGARVHGPGQAR